MAWLGALLASGVQKFKERVFMHKVVFIAALLLFAPFAALAMDGCGAGPCSRCHSLSLKEANELLRDVGQVKRVDSSPVNGLWLLELENGGRQGVVFLDFGKKNLIAGTVFPLTAKIAPQDARVTASARPKDSPVDVSSLGTDDSIVMGNPRGKRRLFVFTDPDCPFCARLHGELKKLVAIEPDLAVYVKMFPLKSHPGAYDKARAILADNSVDTLDLAFSGASIARAGVLAAKKTKKPVDDSIQLGRSLGIDSTPTLVLPDGRIVPGYKDAAELQKLLSAAERKP